LRRVIGRALVAAVLLLAAGGHWQDALDAPVVVARSVLEWLARPAVGSGPRAATFNRSRSAVGGYDAVPTWSVVPVEPVDRLVQLPRCDDRSG
jgi:hypothetical protein